VSGKYLIVNADDYNSDEERNQGILTAAQQGIVTSVSVLANCAWPEASLSGLACVFKKKAGIHLNITKGCPLTPGLLTLVDGLGRFPDKYTVWMKALAGRLDLDEIEREFSAQIIRLKEAEIMADHIDGNNHIHIFPGIAEVTARVARRFGIKKIRLPLELFSLSSLPAPKKILINALSLRARAIFKHSGLIGTDYFAGIHDPCVARVASLRRFIRNLPGGTTELMCHPGYCSASGNPFSNDVRAQETAALIDPEVLEDVTKHRVTLISYTDLS